MHDSSIVYPSPFTSNIVGVSAKQSRSPIVCHLPNENCTIATFAELIKISVEMFKLPNQPTLTFPVLYDLILMAR